MDYAFLRAEGIRLLSRMGGQEWSDFNAHDPGITILEQLCYAITDLGYRCHYSIPELLAADENARRSLFSPATVLTSAPVTVSDLRKCLIDIYGVKNAWVETVCQANPGLVYDPSAQALYLQQTEPQPPHRQPLALRGLYQVTIEADQREYLPPETILAAVNRCLHDCRSLGEDFLPPLILPAQSIVVQAKIQIGAVADPEQLLAQIYHRLSASISPSIPFYTLEQMQARGKTTEQIFEGPALENGFIDDAELAQFQRKIGLRISDLLRVIMAIDGVIAVDEINIALGGSIMGATTGGNIAQLTQDWYLDLPPDSVPFLDIDRSLPTANPSRITLSKNGIPLQPDSDRVRAIILQLKNQTDAKRQPDLLHDIALETASDQQIGHYSSIQHQFPALYGIGAMGLGNAASPTRHAQSKQLKAYLMFFDQLLANYFAQLGSASELFSFYATPFGNGYRSYYSQPVDDPSLGLAPILAATGEHYAAQVQQFSEDPASAAERKNRFLNHLLARFGEQLNDYSLLQYSQASKDALIADKCAFLQNYPLIGAHRGNGFDYSLPGWNGDNRAGLEKRISLKLGIAAYQRTTLAGLNSKAIGGFHAIEHILLRPSAADRQPVGQLAIFGAQAAFLLQAGNKDPYSHQISFIFPDWLERFNSSDFRVLIEHTIRAETPVHLHFKLCWLSRSEMQAFETSYRIWLGCTAALEQDRLTVLRLRDARDRLVSMLGLGKPYPLQDIVLGYPPMVAYSLRANITLCGWQGDVEYQLCDEDGNRISGDPSFTVRASASQIAKAAIPDRPEGWGNTDALVLLTPPIVKDVTYTVCAVRLASPADSAKQAALAAYLFQAIALQAGINTALPVKFLARANQAVSGNQISVNYGDAITVAISNSQEGISYQLVGKGNDTVLSEVVPGNRSGDIMLVSTKPDGGQFREDSELGVRVWRSTNNAEFVWLDRSLSVLVRPNPALELTLGPAIIDYQATAKMTILAPQASVRYTLYRRALSRAEYLPDGTATAVQVANGAGRTLSIQKPTPIRDWSAPGEWTALADFSMENGVLSASCGSLQEDAMFIVKASKIANQQALQLNPVPVLLVRPKVSQRVSAIEASVRNGSRAVLQITDESGAQPAQKGTQAGVSYQLRLNNAENTSVGRPGYDQTDRALETMRVELDLTVEGRGAPALLLLTGPLTVATGFNVLATKTVSGVTAQLSQTVNIGIQG